ncbi:MAG: hypothetical protein ACKO1H_00095 [Tabrizicola sp.]
MTHPNLLALDRHFDATPAFTYALWTHPSLLATWWGPEGGGGVEMAVEGEEVRVGHWVVSSARR